jgi:threonine/homoserine/homoserine lactone efflux protein
MTSHLLTLATIAGLYLLALASPGPTFFVITQLSLSGMRRSALLVALGTVAGSVTWMVLAMLGVAAVLARIDWLYATVRLVGAAYLVWIGFKMLRGALRPGVPSFGAVGALPPAQALRTGLTTSLTNPKAGAFWTSVFVSAFPADAPVWLFAVTAVMVVLISLSWHLGIALAFTSARVQAGYRRLRRSLDALCGGVLVAFGLHLATSR